MNWKRIFLVLGIACANAVAWLFVFGRVFGRAMGGGRDVPAEEFLLRILGFPLVPVLEGRLGLVALNSLIWGVVLGLVVPWVWRANQRARARARVTSATT